MGREIRRVPLGFVFPLDASFFDAAWEQHTATCKKCQAPEDEQEADPCDWDPPSSPAGEGWQLWQTVSTGPITPVFATAEELIDFMSQPVPQEKRPRYAPEPYPENPGGQGWRRAIAEAFVKEEGWIPSGMMQNGKMLTTDSMVAALTPKK